MEIENPQKIKIEKNRITKKKGPNHHNKENQPTHTPRNCAVKDISSHFHVLQL